MEWFVAVFGIHSSHSSLDPNLRWEHTLRRLYPSLAFVDDFTSPLPAVDILLLSRVTLRQYRIKLALSPVSLVLSTTRLKTSLGWVHKFWHVAHSHTGGSTNGRYVLHLLHRLGNDSSPLWTDFSSLPRGNTRRVINTTAPREKYAVAPSRLSADTLYCPSVNT